MTAPSTHSCFRVPMLVALPAGRPMRLAPIVEARTPGEARDRAVDCIGLDWPTADVRADIWDVMELHPTTFHKTDDHAARSAPAVVVPADPDAIPADDWNLLRSSLEDGTTVPSLAPGLPFRVVERDAAGAGPAA